MPEVEPSQWMRTKAAACSRLANWARATFPIETWLVVVRVIATRIPAPLSSAARRFETARLTTASGVCVTTPLVPPPSLIFRVLEPGPIGSVAELL